MRTLLLSLLILSGCRCGTGDEVTPSPQEGPSEPTPEAEPQEPPPSASDYFPMNPGDRWGMQVGDEHHVWGIVSRTEDGTATLFGTDRIAAERFRLEDDGVKLVDPTGGAIGVLIPEPASAGAEWTYTLGAASCSAKIERTGMGIALTGQRVDRCMLIQRTCTHPAGQPFPRETEEQHEELYCAGIGRVRERVRFEPEPEGIEERVYLSTFYRVQGAPAPTPREPFRCDDILLMPSDVHAACGTWAELPTLHADDTPLREGELVHCSFGSDALRFGILQHNEAAEGQRLETHFASVAGEPGELANGVRQYHQAGEGDAPDHFVVGGGEGRFSIVLSSTDPRCSSEGLSRLLPLMQSLVRP